MNFWGICDSMDNSMARVIGEARGLLKLGLSNGDTIIGHLRGNLRREAEDISRRPIVGDWVKVSPSGSEDFVMIESLLPRRTWLKRVHPGTGETHSLVANLDCLLIATSVNDDLNFRRLERYIAMSFDAGVTPYILLTKIDLVENPQEILAQVKNALLGVEVIAVQTQPVIEVRDLLSRMQSGQTWGLIGSSGVGKSSLVNAMLGTSILETKSIREDDARGRHTTTARSLWKLSNGTFLVDNPGLREIQLDVTESALGDTFQDIADWMKQCRFSDCRHRTEPGCQILEALESGQLSQERWASFCKLEREREHFERKRDPLWQSEQRKRWKVIHKAARQRKKPIF